MTHPLDIELLDVVTGEADPAVAEAIKAHAAGCRDCRAKMVSIVGHYMDLSLLDEEATDG